MPGEYEIFGAVLLTVMVTVALALPVALLAVMVYVLVAALAVGVPDITPVEVLNDRPAGSGALMDQLLAVPPVLVGVNVGMVAPTE